MSWDDVVGQKRVSNILKKAIINNRVSCAYLFIGPDGVGKHLVAKELAKALNCEKNFGNACGQCISCSKIERNIHPDVSIISPQGQGIKIEQINKIREEVFLKPLEGRYKFYIIDKAEGLVKPREEAGNVLLKLLEEPPAYAIFILIPTEGQVLLSTIISRCQKIRFDYLSLKEVEKILKRKFNYDKDTARLAAGFSFGRVDNALFFADENRKKEREEVRNNLNTRFLKSLLLWAKELAPFRDKVMDILDIMIVWFRDVLVYKVTHKEELLINVDYIKDIQREEDTVQNLMEKINLVKKTKRLIENNVNLQLALEVMFMEMSENGPSSS